MSPVPILEPDSRGLYRVQRGRPGASELMSPNVGMGGRYVITTGEAATVNGGAAGVAHGWRALVDVHSPGFALLVLGVLLILTHARFGVSIGGKGSAGVGG